MSEDAPYHGDLAEGPEPARCLWAETADGVRLRVAAWGGPPYAFVLNGRSEHLEKYGPVANLLAGRGFGMISLDWRGQGLSDRLSRRNLGFVRSYTDYQTDIDTALAALEVRANDLPLWIAHSMGGLIAWRALNRDISAPKALVMTGPMLGLKPRGPIDGLVAWVIRIAARIGFARRLLPGSTFEPTVIAMPFEKNPLTRSRAYWDIFHQQIANCPALGIGGPTIGWAAASIREMTATRTWPVPPVPTLVVLGGSEDVVSVPAIRHFAQSNPGARLLEIAEGEHELLMERPEVEVRVWAAIDELVAETIYSEIPKT